MKIKYTPVTKKSYETNQCGIQFEVEINGKKAVGYWSVINQYPMNGVDINELRIGQYDRITIFSSGGGRRYYPIHGCPTIAEKQPKCLRFTGRTLNVSGLKKVFVDKLNNPGDAVFSKEFIDYFGM